LIQRAFKFFEILQTDTDRPAPSQTSARRQEASKDIGSYQPDEKAQLEATRLSYMTVSVPLLA
jgi:hypothetical protein